MLSLGWNLVWTIINLIVLYLLMKKFLISPVQGIMEKRKAMIAGQLKEAESAKAQAEELKAHYENALANAREESAEIVSRAKNEAKDISERAVKDANEQAERIIETAKSNAEAEKKSALQGAKSEIAGLAMEAAKRILEGGSSTRGNRMLYDEFLAKAGDTDDTDGN